MTRPTIADDMKNIISAVPRHDTIGNLALKTELGWSDTRYWRILKELVANGRIVRGRGRWGSVRRFKRPER